MPTGTVWSDFSKAFLATVRYDFGHRRGITLPAENYPFWAMPDPDRVPIMT
jgi:hypothetical protein